MSVIKEYLEALIRKVADNLIVVYSRSYCNQAGDYGLIFPKYRGGSLRISEQESKLLFVQHLTKDRQFLFSVEKPTIQTYRQKGSRDMSARSDITLYGQDSQPTAHFELKCDNCKVEDIRKDLEKLVREQRTGVWFHTLKSKNRGTLPKLMGKFRKAFADLSKDVRTSNSSYLICFCVLEDRLLLWKWLQFMGDCDQNLAAIETVFDEHSNWQAIDLATGQVKEYPVAPLRSNRVSQLGQGSKGTGGKGARKGFFVLLPSVTRNTFLHLSVRGGRYRIRNYLQTDPSHAPPPFTIPDYLTFEALQQSGLISQWLPVSAADLHHSLVKEPAYWYERISQVNSRQLPR